MRETTGRTIASEPKPRRAMHGVTLFELIVVMGIIAILAAIAVPSYKYVTTSNRIAAEINGLLGDLQFARSEAIKEGVSVQVCVSTDGASCATGINSNDWQNGWIVLAPGITAPLRAQSAFTSTDTLVANHSVSAITFNREGFATGVPASEVLTLHAATPTSTSTRCLTVQLIGLMAVQGYDGATCT